MPILSSVNVTSGFVKLVISMDLFQANYSRRLFLARHGESMANLNKQISGQLDVSLSAKGKDQSQCLKDVLQNETLTAIYSSNLKRTIETALPTAEHHNLPIQTLENLKERHFGIFQGKTIGKTDFEDKTIEPYKQMNNIEGGENLANFEQRIKSCLNELMANANDSILIVGHRNTNEIILAQLLSLGPLTELNLNIKNKYLYEIILGKKPQISTIRLGGEHHGKRYPGLKDD
jgi:broad specificity phosphatase PhoE